MPSKATLVEPWRSFFSDIDASLAAEVALHCLGGFVMTMLYGSNRLTADVDVLPITSDPASKHLLNLAGQGSILHKKHKIYLQVVGVATVPDNYEARLTEMFAGTFRHLRLVALDPYDLALSKLERNAPRDREDFKYLARTIQLDLNILQERYREELRPYLGNPGREDLTLKLWIETVQEYVK